MEHTGLLFLFTWQPTKSSNGVNVRAHLLRKNYSRNFSSIRSTPYSSLAELSMKNVLYLTTGKSSAEHSFVALKQETPKITDQHARKIIADE